MLVSRPECAPGSMKAPGEAECAPIGWTDCGDGTYQCTPAQVPLDYHRPEGTRLISSSPLLPTSPTPHVHSQPIKPAAKSTAKGSSGLM